MSLLGTKARHNSLYFPISLLQSWLNQTKPKTFLLLSDIQNLKFAYSENKTKTLTFLQFCFVFNYSLLFTDLFHILFHCFFPDKTYSLGMYPLKNSSVSCLSFTSLWRTQRQRNLPPFPREGKDMPFTTSSCCHFMPSCPRRCGTSCVDTCLRWASSPPVFIQLSCNDIGACVMLLLLVQFWTSVGTVGVLFLMLLKFLLLLNFMPLANCSSQPLLLFFQTALTRFYISLAKVFAASYGIIIAFSLWLRTCLVISCNKT